MSCWICKPGLTSKKQSRDQFEGETSRIDAAEQCAVLGVRYATAGSARHRPPRSLISMGTGPATRVTRHRLGGTSVLLARPDHQGARACDFEVWPHPV